MRYVKLFELKPSTWKRVIDSERERVELLKKKIKGVSISATRLKKFEIKYVIEFMKNLINKYEINKNIYLKTNPNSFKRSKEDLEKEKEILLKKYPNFNIRTSKYVSGLYIDLNDYIGIHIEKLEDDYYYLIINSQYRTGNTKLPNNELYFDQFSNIVKYIKEITKN